MQKRKNFVISLVMVFVFLVSLFPVTNVEAADKYGKVKHKYKFAELSEIPSFVEGGLVYSNNKLDKGYTDIYEMQTESNQYVFFDIITLDEGAFECAITDDKGKIICQKKINSRNGGILRELKKGKYFFKVRALKKSVYQFGINSGKKNKSGKSYIEMSGRYFDDDMQSITIISNFGKVDWKIFYDENRSKSKTVKHAKSVKVDKKAKYVYMIVGEVVLFYPIINIEDEAEKESAITKTLSVYGNAYPIYDKNGNFNGKYKYSVLYDYINLSNKTIKNFRFCMKSVNGEKSDQQFVNPYGSTAVFVGAFHLKNQKNILTKVTVEYMDGSEEVLFEGEHGITWYYQPVMY